MKQVLSKTATISKDLYPIAALPLLIFMAIQVYTIAQDNAKKTQEILNLQEEISEIKQTHRNEINKFEQQLDYLIKKLIDKTSTITIPYTPKLQTDLKRHRVNEDQMPGFWFPVSPILALDRRQLNSRFVGGREHQG